MNKNLTANEKNVVISATRINNREIKRTFGEPIMKICWEENGCGVFVGMKSKDTYIFASNFDMKRLISTVWDTWEVSAAVENANRSDGIDGIIKVCLDFVTVFSTYVMEKNETTETA